MPQPVLLLGAGHRCAYDEFVLTRIAAARPVLLVDAAPPAWAQPCLAGHLAADPGKGGATASAVVRFAARHRVRGVLTFSGEYAVAAARIAGQLGLPGPSLATAEACTDPPALRALLAACTVPTGDPGGPAAPRVSAETVVLDGEIRIAAITRTTLGPAPARQPLRHTVHAHDGLLHNRFLRLAVDRTVHALGVDRGVLHIGLTLTDRGPRVTDAAPHLPGDLIPLLVKRATGVDLAQAAAALATGEVPDTTPTRQRAAAIQFAYPAATGRLDRLDLSSDAAHEPGAERMLLTQHTGNHVTAGPQATAADRLAHWVAVGETPDACDDALRRMAHHLSAEIAPLADAA
ncbi:MAG: hypothetical protein JF597_22915 [Streptomyces sp.]|uniref:hypothetical protein n=1 Tax=Streptomyces sp. TaxID=1931 RepID=UPI0025FECC9A|nr:hypothetical protein [Streptomyces sp.]MBW8796343.1 hypothetical protein [Streptomyces sp.]